MMVLPIQNIYYSTASITHCRQNGLHIIYTLGQIMQGSLPHADGFSNPAGITQSIMYMQALSAASDHIKGMHTTQ